MLTQLLDRVTAGSDVGFRAACSGFVLVVSAVFLFTNLGFYALWDDESETALLAQGVLASGDTTAVVGHNLNARRGGINLINLADRLTPPLPTYLMAASFAIGRQNAFWARLPLALCGLAAVAIMLALLWKKKATNWEFVIFTVALLANVSFFLYCRNARYYGAVLACAIAAGFLYLTGLSSTLRRVALSGLGAAILFCHPIAFMQAAGVMAADWFFFVPKTKPRAAALVALALPFAAIAVPGLCIWNPLFVKSSATYLGQMTIFDRLTLLIWNIRDLFAAEFIPLAAVVYVPWALYRTRDRWLRRCFVALGTVVLITTATTYQAVSVTSVADVRYMITAIPLGLAATVRSFDAIPVKHRLLGLLAAVLALATNVGSAKLDFQRGPDSTVIRFMHELAVPVREPYTAAAAWLRDNAPARASVLVVPDYMMYPLMFHAPEQMYAWQISDSSDPQFRGIDAIHFQGRIPPDFIVAFGPIRQTIEQAMSSWRSAGLRYEQVGTLPVFWKDTYRPEVFWRTFTSVEGFDPAADGIFFYRRLQE